MTILKIFKQHESVKIPKYATAGSACFDLTASLIPGDEIISYKFQHPDKSKSIVSEQGTITIHAFERLLVPTHMILDIPNDYQVKIHPRSGLSLKQGLVIANMEGVVDSDYVDPLYVMMWNISGITQQIHNGDRIAQAELVKVEPNVEIVEIDEAPKQKTDRIGGLGSTGVKSG
jgi:dUTP pyrophosphatase